MRSNPNYVVQKNKLVASGALIVGGSSSSQNGNLNGFGKANRPSTPIKGVLSNNFGNEAEKDMVGQYEVFQFHKKNLNNQQKTSNIGKNRALMLKEKYDQEHRALQSKKQANQFVMKRFAEVNARTNTHNSVAKSVQSIRTFDEPKSRPSEQQCPAEVATDQDAMIAYNYDAGNPLE